ncbi:MAG: hypothetical protein GQ564_07445 [Bacteroidales bacterium]|nr:hypothetical protein [Bacteroidales bacterium]
MKNLKGAKQLNKAEQLKIFGGASRSIICELGCLPILTRITTEEECSGPGYQWVSGKCYLCCI